MRISDWSSDVCSSDLVLEDDIRPLRGPPRHVARPEVALPWAGHIGGDRAGFVVFAHAKRLGEIFAIDDQVGELDTRVEAAADGGLQGRAIEGMRLFGQG